MYPKLIQMGKYSRYVSDGEWIYGVEDMSVITSLSKEDLADVYVYTYYHYKFELTIHDMLAIGVLQKKDEKEEYAYPFLEVAETLDEIRKLEVFSPNDIIEMDKRVLAIFEADIPKDNNPKPKENEG